MEKKWKASRRSYYLALSFFAFTPIFFSILQIWAVVRVVLLYGWDREPVFWAGAIVWGTVGYFLYELKTWLRKKTIAALVFSFSILALAHLARTGQFPMVFQFMMWGGLSVVMAMVRVFVEEDLLRSYGTAKRQAESSSQAEKRNDP
jgi:hypothetical protein